MILRQTYKYRLYGHRRNKHLVSQIDIAGIIWNHALALQKRYYRLTGKYIGYNRMAAHIAKLKKTARFGFWRKLGSQAIQDILKRQDKAYQRFFAWKRREGPKVGLPRFRKVKKYPSFTLSYQAGWELLGGNRMRIGRHNFKFVKHRKIKGEIKTVTIKRDRLGRLYVCFSVVIEMPEPFGFAQGRPATRTDKIAGFDFGLKTFLKDDQGQAYSMPEYFKAALDEIARLNRQLSHKVKGSRNWHKAKRRLAKAHERVANLRRDFHFKLAHKLLQTFDVLVFETLNMDGMKRLWGRKVSDLGFAQFLTILQHMARSMGKLVVQIDPWEPTTQTCSCCGHQQELDLRDRVFGCENCGMVLDRDHNAAINIKTVGASTIGLGEVRHSFQSAFAARPQEAQVL